MITQSPAQMICYPPAALNGGPLETAPQKVGEWVWQPKVDDWRAVIHTPSKTVWNQYGKLSSVTDKFKLALSRVLVATVGVAEWLDVGVMENRNDLMRGCIIVFDWIVPHASYNFRRARLEAMFPVLPDDVPALLKREDGQVRDSVYLINEFVVEDAVELYRSLQRQNEAIGHKFFEGLVAKRADSPYQFGRRPKPTTADWVKHRFDQGGHS